MPDVTGSIHTISGGSMVGAREVELLFYLENPNIGAVSHRAGIVYPTEPVEASIESNGDFEVTLANTFYMLQDAWYRMQIRWLGAHGNAALIDFPDWKIRVPAEGGVLSELIDLDGPGQGSPANSLLLWWSLTPPSRPRRGMHWVEVDPTDPENPASTGNVYRWD